MIRIAKVKLVGIAETIKDLLKLAQGRTKSIRAHLANPGGGAVLSGGTGGEAEVGDSRRRSGEVIL